MLRVVVASVVVALCAMCASTAGAASPAAGSRVVPLSSNDSFVTVDRPVREMTIDPGATVVETVTIKNQTLRDVDVTVASNDLAVRTDGSRSPKFAAVGSQPRGVGSWISAVPAKVRIAAGTERLVRLRITAPADARPGGWQGAAVLSVTGVGADGNVGITQEVPVLLLVGVRGDAGRGVRTTITPESRLRLRGGRASWKVTVANTGDVHESYGGRVVVQGRTGGRRAVRLEPGILLPGERRTQTVEVELREAPDVVAADVELVTRGRSGRDVRPTDEQAPATSASVYVLPWWLPLVLGVALVVIVLRVRRRRTPVEHDVE